MSAPRPSLRRIRAELRPHRRAIGIATASAIGGAAFGSVAPRVVQVAIDGGIEDRRPGVLAGAIAVFAVLAVGQVATTYIERKVSGRLAHTYMASLRGRLLDHLHRLDPDVFARDRAGRQVSRFTTEIENLERLMGAGVSLTVVPLFTLGVTLAMMFTTSVKLSLVTLMVVPPLALVTIWFNRRARSVNVEIRDRVSGLVARLNEYLIGMRVAQAFTIEEQQRAAFEELNQDTYGSKMRMAWVGTVFYAVIEFLQPVALLLVLWYGGTLAGRGEVSVGTVIAFTLFAGRLFQPIEQFADFAHLAPAAAASFSTVFGFFDEQPRVADRWGAVPLVPGEGRIALENVTFRYSDADRPVLRDITLAVEPGERVALVGGSGSGKSTLAKIIARFYDPDEGRVLIDGQDTRGVTLASLRSYVSLVPQEGFLFDGTILDNIAAAKPEAIDDAELLAQVLGLPRALGALPSGVHTRVAARGLSLSAGQRQLVALARVFLASPRVLILDEATSQLDPLTETLVEEALNILLEGRTSIVIAHRVSSAYRADRVAVLENGTLAALGRADDLERTDPAFRRWLAGEIAQNQVA